MNYANNHDYMRGFGFWVLIIPSLYIVRTCTFFGCDDGFGNLIHTELPIHWINAIDWADGYTH